VTGFSAEWLAMREPIDAAARDRAIARRLSELLPPGVRRRCFDLGCGTGSNVRYLAPLLGAPQRWVLVDSDEQHLRRARELAGGSAMGEDHGLPEGDEAAGINGMRVVRGAPPIDGMPAMHATSIDTRCIDLAGDLGQLELEEGALVSAAALLDLVSAAWLTRLLDRCRACDAIVLFALTYDGRIALEPGDPADAAVRDLVNRHQRTDKGFGPALGPAAASFARARLEDLQYRTQSAPSDWRLEPADALVQECLLRDWARAAVEIAPAAQELCERWLRKRLAHLERGQSSIRVGHQDLIAWPAGSRDQPGA
jgi:SAM-dependent methyltransferase